MVLRSRKGKIMPKGSFGELTDVRSRAPRLEGCECKRLILVGSEDKALWCLSSRLGDLCGCGCMLVGDGACMEEVDSDTAGLPTLWLSTSPPRDEESLVRQSPSIKPFAIAFIWITLCSCISLLYSWPFLSCPSWVAISGGAGELHRLSWEASADLGVSGTLLSGPSSIPSVLSSEKLSRSSKFLSSNEPVSEAMDSG